MSAKGGRIAISMQVTGSGEKRVLKFEWREHGVDGLKDPQRTGFGIELLSRILPYDLGADTSVEFDPKGLRFAMTLPGKHIAQPAEKSKD